MADRVAAWVETVDQLWPQRDAQGWDQTGLQVGDPAATVTAVLMCLDVTPAVLDEAADRGADLIVAHHPLLFRPLPRLTPDSASGRLALRAAAAGVAVLAVHTNFDAAADGTTTPVARLLGLRAVRPLQALAAPPPLKLVTFVPTADTAAVLAALSGAGAGRIGAYDECSFRVRGTGTFRPSSQATPAVGETGRRNEVAEDRLEMVVARDDLEQVLSALRRAHPYEEVAFDLLALEPEPGAGAKGMGGVGDLPQPLPLRAVARTLADGLPAPLLRVAGDPARMVRRIAACGGAGDALVDQAMRAGADVYVTGDLRHHTAVDALTMGLALIDAGHYPTEAAALPVLRRRLAEAASGRGLTAPLLASATSTQPWVSRPFD